MLKIIKVFAVCLAISALIAAGVIASTYSPENTLLWHLEGLPLFTLVVLPLVSSIALLIYEPHPGWKRLSLILAIVLCIPLSYIWGKFLLAYPSPKTSLTEILIGCVFTFPLVVILMIVGKASVFWIKDGFARAKG